MTSDETYQYDLGSRRRGRRPGDATPTPAGREGMFSQCHAQAHKLADCACAKGARAQSRCVAGCVLLPEGVGAIENWITSYVRARLRTIAGEAFSISRHTSDYVAKILDEQFLADTDSVLQRILDFAALRCLYEGESTTVTLDDVRAALRSAAPPTR